MSVRRRTGRSATSLARWAAATLLTAASVWADPAFDTLPDAKALAVLPGQPEVTGLAHSQPHDLAASLQARASCEAAASGVETPATGAQRCEIVRLNDVAVTSGRDIRAQVPDTHPLFLWRYTHGRNTVFLAGSIHILKPSLYPLPAQFDLAFDSADHLVLEVHTAALSPADLQQRTLAHALLPDDQTLDQVVPQDLYRRLDERLAVYGTSTQMVNRAKPALVMNQLVLSRLMALGYEPDSGAESYFLARRRHQQIHELESVEAQLALLFDQPLATQVELLKDTLDLEPDIEPLLAGLMVAWLSGDDARLLALFEAQTGDSPEARAFNRALLDDRNHTMAAGIRRYLESATGGTYFVLVGAAHLVGDPGIVALLERQGVRGERIHSTDRIGGNPHEH